MSDTPHTNNASDATPEDNGTSDATETVASPPASQQTTDIEPQSAHPTIGVLASGFAGLVAALAALAAGEFLASLAAPRPGPVTAVANRVVDNAPTWFVELGKNIFGLADKPALVAGTIILSALFGFGLGVAARRRFPLGLAGLGFFGLLGMLAIGVDAQGSWPLAIIANLGAVAIGGAALWLILYKARSTPQPATSDRTPGGTNPTANPPIAASIIDPAYSRRRFISTAAGIGASSVVTAAAANFIRQRATVVDARNTVQLAKPAGTTTETTTRLVEAELGPVASTPGITPIIMPNDDFYLIDTAILVPQVNPNDWSLQINGMVDNPLEISYQELLDRSTLVETVTLSCVSNEVGGSLVGNAVWQGVALTDLLDEAGINPNATQIASWSVDGWSCGFPTDLAYDGRVAMVAVGMNDEPLPLAHGFPARLVVSGLYGYVSATKWLNTIELTTLEDFDGYWIPRGWSKLGPVKLQSRIDTPRNGSSISVGEQVAVAGVAWAPNTGIKAVEVKIGDDDWREAELGDSLGIHAWRQWRLNWTPATAGSHLIRVRAINETGETQTSAVAQPAPNGASGWHTIEVHASA